MDTYQELVNLFVQKFTDAAIKNKQRKVVDILLYEHFTALEKHIQSKPRVVNIPTDARSTEKKLIEQQAAVLNQHKKEQAGDPYQEAQDHQLPLDSCLSIVCHKELEIANLLSEF